MNKSTLRGDVQPVSAWLCLGSNIGDRYNHLRQATSMIAASAGEVLAASSVYETMGWETTSESLFLNQVICIGTRLEAPALLSELHRIEHALGRRRSFRHNEDRIIDIDLLFFADHVINARGIEVPHPRLHLRRFVLVPLGEVAPALRHPVLGATVSELLRDCKDTLEVRLAEGGR